MGKEKEVQKIASTFGWEKFDSNLNINVELNSTGFKFNCLDEFWSWVGNLELHLNPNQKPKQSAYLPRNWGLGLGFLRFNNGDNTKARATSTARELETNDEEASVHEGVSVKARHQRSHSNCECFVL